jgi:ribosomal RNA-processing protein 36
MQGDVGSSSDSDSDAPPEAVPTGSSGSRANKNRPSQMSSRKPVSTFRIAPGLCAGGGSSTTSRDPRFDPRGEADFNEEGWRKAYDFVFEKQHEEVADMKRSLGESKRAAKRAKQRGGGAKRQRTRDKVLQPEEAAELKLELERTQNRLAADARREKQRALKAAVRREEVAAVKDGKRPFFQKRAALRERELVMQYEELKKEGKVDRFLAKRRKKLDAKEHKRMPTAWD